VKKILDNRVHMCHCIVVFLSYLELETGSRYPGNCNRVPETGNAANHYQQVEYRQAQTACNFVSYMFAWTSVLYLTGLMWMAVDRVLKVCRQRLRLHHMFKYTACGIWLTVLGFCLYATAVTSILVASRGANIRTTLICTVHVDDRLEIGLSTPTEHPQNSRSYFVSSKFLSSYHYVHSISRVCSSMRIFHLSTPNHCLFSKYFICRLLIFRWVFRN